MRPTSLNVPFCLWCLAGCGGSEPQGVINVKGPAELPALVGWRIQLVGMVAHTKIPQILGVDVEPLRSYEGRTMKVTGVLRQNDVTAEEMEKAQRQLGGPVAHRGPGIYYYLEELKYEAQR